MKIYIDFSYVENIMLFLVKNDKFYNCSGLSYVLR